MYRFEQSCPKTILNHTVHTTRGPRGRNGVNSPGPLQINDEDNTPLYSEPLGDFDPNEDIYSVTDTFPAGVYRLTYSLHAIGEAQVECSLNGVALPGSRSADGDGRIVLFYVPETAVTIAVTNAGDQVLTIDEGDVDIPFISFVLLEQLSPT